MKYNPPQGIKKCDGLVVADPQNVSPSDWVKVHSSEHFTVNQTKKIFCSECHEEIAIKSVIYGPIVSRKVRGEK